MLCTVVTFEDGRTEIVRGPGVVICAWLDSRTGIMRAEVHWDIATQEEKR